MTSEAELNRIYDRHVKLDPIEMAENSRIANAFVNGLISSIAGEKPQKLKQGSSVEGLKVSASDDYDFLLLYKFDEGRKHMIKAIQSTNLHESGQASIQEYWRLDVDPEPRKRKNRPWISKWVDKQSSIHWILAPKLFRHKMQSYLVSYVDSLKRYPNTIAGVRSLSNPSIGNPAMSVEITKRNGKKFSIDISIAVDIYMDGYTKRFFAKKHGEDTDGLLWRVTREKQELDRILNMNPKIKENYKFAKYILKPVVKNSFVLKTAMFHLVQDMKHLKLLTKSDFLEEMIRYLLDAYGKGSLPGFFNKEYDVLEKYGDQYLSDKENQLEKFSNRIEYSDGMKGLIKSLAAKYGGM